MNRLRPRQATPIPLPQPYHGAPLTQVECDAGPMWLRSDDAVILPHLQHYRTWEHEEGGLIRRIVRPGSTFVDVGANVGYFSRLVATTCQPGRILAFEPHPDLVEILRLNVWGLHPGVEVFPVALGTSTGTVPLHTAEHNPGDTRVGEGGVARTDATMVAAVAAFDEIAGGRVDVVKMDVQGYEVEVLRGMLRTIRDNPQMIVVAEFFPVALRERGVDPSGVLTEYRSMGFEIGLLRAGAPLRTTDEEIMEFATGAGPDGQANLVLRQP